MHKSSTHTGLRQLGWLLAIWCASVSALGIAAWLMRKLMAWGGMLS